MGDILFDFKNKNKIKPMISIERRIDDIETQSLKLWLEDDCWLTTETGSSIELHGKDKNCNRIEIILPISVKELKEALDNYRE